MTKRPKVPAMWEMFADDWRAGYEAGEACEALALPGTHYGDGAYTDGHTHGLRKYYGIAVKRSTEGAYQVRCITMVSQREVAVTVLAVESRQRDAWAFADRYVRARFSEQRGE